jgi:hypothetical protein
MVTRTKMSMRPKLHQIAAAGALLLLAGGAQAADPLDRVSGTEGWKVGLPESIGDELKDWYRARISWRKAGRELRVQRTRSRRLAQLITRSAAKPDPRSVRRVLRSRRVRAFTAGEGAVKEPDIRRGRRRPGARRGSTPPPPQWIKVPVERLDSRGQAIDDEGDRELRKVYKKRRRRGR